MVCTVLLRRQGRKAAQFDTGNRASGLTHHAGPTAPSRASPRPWGSTGANRDSAPTRRCSAAGTPLTPVAALWPKRPSATTRTTAWPCGTWTRSLPGEGKGPMFRYPQRAVCLRPPSPRRKCDIAVASGSSEAARHRLNGRRTTFRPARAGPAYAGGRSRCP